MYSVHIIIQSSMDFVLEHLKEEELHPAELAARFVQRRIVSLPHGVSVAVGDVIHTDEATVFVPAHKPVSFLAHLPEVDPSLALGGSMGESEMFAVLLPGTRLVVKDIVEKAMDKEFRLWFFRRGPPDGYMIGSNSWGMNTKEERRACEEGQRLQVHRPPRRVFLEVQVEAVPEDVGVEIEIERCKHRVRPASKEDCTDGFVLHEGARGFIFTQIVCPPDFSWSLEPAPNPAHPDHDEYREHKKILDQMRRLRLRAKRWRRHLPFQAKRLTPFVVEVDNVDDVDDDDELG